MDDLSKKPTIESIKDNLSYAEGHTEVRNIAGRLKPESLCNLSDEEYKRLEKKLVRKLDLFILPTIGILYILNYIDRQNLSAAKLQGIMEDLNMNEQQFATAISILFVGYVLSHRAHMYGWRPLADSERHSDTFHSRSLATYSSPRSHVLACTSAQLSLSGVASPLLQQPSSRTNSF